MKAYKISFKDDKEKFYVKTVTLGGEPFIQIIPAFFEEDIGFFEKDKAEKYVEMLNKQYEKTNIQFGLEETEI